MYTFQSLESSGFIFLAQIAHLSGKGAARRSDDYGKALDNLFCIINCGRAILASIQARIPKTHYEPHHPRTLPLAVSPQTPET